MPVGITIFSVEAENKKFMLQKLSHANPEMWHYCEVDTLEHRQGLRFRNKEKRRREIHANYFMCGTRVEYNMLVLDFTDMEEVSYAIHNQ